MIRANELRIGNLIKTPDCDVWITTELDITAICTFKLNAEPIRLTLERLMSFGFAYLKHKDGTQGVYSNGKMNLSCSNSGNIYRVNQLIPYVHTLQNIYFALYEEEIVKLEEKE